MTLKGMLKWAVGKDDRPINSTKSLKKRRKVQVDMQSGDASQVGLISGCCKHRNNLQGPSRFLHKNRHHHVGIINKQNQSLEPPDNNNSTCFQDNYKKDQDQRLPEIPHNTNNNNNIINSDSKSLLYMSLDHLPMAIVKQYERMLQDTPTPQSILKTRHSPSNNNIPSNNTNHRPSNIKIQNQNSNNYSCKKSHSKSVRLQQDVGDRKSKSNNIFGRSSPSSKTTRISPVPSSKSKILPSISILTATNKVVKKSSSPVNIKEAHNRPLKVLSSTKSENQSNNNNNSMHHERKNKTSSPEVFNEKYPHNLVFPNSNNSTKVIDKTNTLKTKTNIIQIPCTPKSTVQQQPTVDISKDDTQNKILKSSHHPESKSKQNKVIIPTSDQTRMHSIHENEENTLQCITSTSHNYKINDSTPALTEGLMKLPTHPITRPHDTTDPQFLEKSITYNTPPVSRCAKKLTLKRSELRKLERLKTQTERLNRFLKKYYHDCLPNLPEEEDEQCSPEEKSLCLSILRTHWREVKTGSENGNEDDCSSKTLPNVKNPWDTGNSIGRSSYKSNNNKTRPSSISTINTTGNNSSLLFNSFFDDDEHDSVNWQNLRNAAALISYSNDSCLLPMIQEDSAEVSSSTSICSKSRESESQLEVTRAVEIAREACKNHLLDDSFLMSSTDLNVDDSLILMTKDSLGLSSLKEKRDRKSEFVKISYDCEDEEEGGFGMKKLKGLKMEPLGDLFDTPASLAEDEGFMSPYPPEVYSPASSSSTFNRFSVSSSGKGSGSTEDVENEHENYDYDEDDYDKDEVEISNLPHTQSSSSSSSDITSEEGGPKYILKKHENANYLLENELCNNNCKDETWNSHGYIIPEEISSPCGSHSLNSHHSCITESSDVLENKRENEDEESFDMPYSDGFALAFSTPMISKTTRLPQASLRSYRMKKSTPRRLVRKPPVNSAFSGKGEVLIRTYNNGDYATVHVVHARRLQPHHRSSWQLSIKVSLLPEAEATFTRSESILVPKNRSWVKIDQKFSFEISDPEEKERKVFLTFAKRLEKKTFFLGWTILDLTGSQKNSQSWLKLRKRKMSTATYSLPSVSSVNHCPSPYIHNSRAGSMMESPSPILVEGSSRCDYDIQPKSQLQNSSTMDSGVEDCCEGPPPPPVPSIDLDDKAGQRVKVKMVKGEGGGYGFSVVWVIPPRIERLEMGKAADIAGLKIGDLIIGVNGEEVTNAPNTTIYTKMKTTGNELGLEVWRKYPQAQTRILIPPPPANTTTNSSSKCSSISNTNETINSNEGCQNRETHQSQLPQNIQTSSTNINSPISMPTRLHSQPPPISILKPPPPAPPSPAIISSSTSQQQQQQSSSGSSSWRIRFNIELLDNEDDCLKQFFICELKFFRKIVAALDRYLIPAQANHLLTPQEINLIFSHVIKIITVTKRILNFVADGSSASDWKLGRILLSTHSDHLSEMVSAYSAYAKTLGYSAMILSEKMSIQEFARFVLETPVPKGHLDMTSLLFAPFEHLRNICEICEEIQHNNDDWVELATNLKECYADIVCETDFMEPISHISMKKNPLLSVRDLEKRIVSTTCQAVKVCEKGRKWLFGSRLFKKESDGSWTPVWAFLFSDIIVLTSHTTRDRVFFVKEAPIRLEDVVTLHFNLPRKHENEFRLLFGSEPAPLSRLGKILPIHRNKKSNQIILRTPNIQLKSMWKLFLQKQIISLNTRLSKSSSSNFSISEFCERFPITPQDEEETSRPDQKDHLRNGILPKGTPIPSHKGPSKTFTSNTIFDKQNYSDERNLSVIKEERTHSQTIKPQNSYTPDGLSSMNKDLFKSKISRPLSDRRNQVAGISEEIKVTTQPNNDPSDIIEIENANHIERISSKNNREKTSKTENDTLVQTLEPTSTNSNDRLRFFCNENENEIQFDTQRMVKLSKLPVQRTTTATQVHSKSVSPINNNNNEVHDFNIRKNENKNTCPCEIEKPLTNVDVRRKEITQGGNNLSGKSFYQSSPNHSPPSQKPLTCNKKAIMCEDKFGNDTMQTKSKEVKGLSGICSYDEKSLVANIEPTKTEIPLLVSHQGERLQRNNTPSPSMNNNRVEALKYEGINMTKSKPGSRIMTNAHLKSIQKELLIQKESTIGQCSSSGSDRSLEKTTDSSTSNSYKSGVTVMDESLSPLPPRCQSENGFIKPKSVHTDSPIMTGYGSDRSRRRVLYDYKVRRDYPELFGITPKDRRSFIKSLVEQQPENDKSLVTPYYFSPLPTPKFAKLVESQETKSIKENNVSHQVPLPIVQIPKQQVRKLSIEMPQKISKDNIIIKEVKAVVKSGKEIVCTSESVNTKEMNDEMEKIECDEMDERTDNDISLKEIVRGILRNELDQDSDDESEDEFDDGGGHEERAQVHRHRSPEESSNDSGISDEVTEKSKRIEENERFQSNVAVNSSEVNNVKFTSKTNDTIISRHDQKQILPKALAFNSTSKKQNNTIDHVYFVEGEEETSMEEMVVLKADKSCGTDDDYFNEQWTGIKGDKSTRKLMAERREAFFASYQSNSNKISYSTPSYSKPYNQQPFESPLIVKIVEGGTLQSTIPECKPITPPTERVQLTRLPEKERTPPVERVESSDSSTSSDHASASPAAENGTTDPSWSSSSSSLAGCGISKDEPCPSTSVAAPAVVTSSVKVAYSNNNTCINGESYGQCFASTSSRSSSNVVTFNDLSNELPNSSFSSFGTNSHFTSTNGFGLSKRPEIVVTQESPETPTVKNGYCSDGEEEEDSVLCNEKNDSSGSERKGFLRVESNDSTAENYGDDDDYNFDEEDDLSQCSVATINRYGTFESLEKIEIEDSVSGLPDFSRPMPRSKARFTFEDEDSDDDADLFEEDFESDFNFRFPSQIQDNTYSVSRLGPLPPLLEEDYEDDMYEEHKTGEGSSSISSAGTSAYTSHSHTLRSRHETGLRNDNNSFLLARLATMYARSSISPLKILRDLWLKKRYRQNWAYKE